jgi:hypothetical protein
MESDQVLAKIYATKTILTGPSINDITENVEVLYLGNGASKLLQYPVTLKTPLSQFQKDSKTSCDEIQHFDIFPQP